MPQGVLRPRVSEAPDLREWRGECSEHTPSPWEAAAVGSRLLHVGMHPKLPASFSHSLRGAKTFHALCEMSLFLNVGNSPRF